MEKSIFNGKLVALSENDDCNTVTAKFLICPLNESNANGVGLREVDLSEEEQLGLTNQPIVCKVIKNVNGDYDFTGHNMKVSYTQDDKGNLVKSYDFDTSPIGFHNQVTVEDIELDGETKKCIVASALLWTRYEKAMSVIERLGENLRTSWEIGYGSYYIEDGVKWIKDITWLGNCCLGENVAPAYNDAGLLEVAEENSDMNLIVAFTKDLQIENSEKQGGIKMDKNKKVEKSALTMEDLYNKISNAVNSVDDNYYYVSRIYPLEFLAIARNWSENVQEDDYVSFTYAVNSDETISITKQENVQMVFIPKTDYEKEVSELKEKAEKKETELSQKLDEIIKLGEDIKSKETVISEKDAAIAELTPFKEKVETMEKEQKEKEISEKKEELKNMAIKTNYITSEEIETSEEIKEAIEKLDETKIKTIIANRVIENSQKVEDKKVETSETKKDKHAEVNLNATQSKEDPLEVIKNFIK